MSTTFDPVDLRRESDPELLEDGRTFARALSELIRIVQFRDRDRACCYDVSVSQCYALEGVVEAGALTVNDLAGHLYLDKSTASRIANGLVERGLLERERSSEDGRVVRLVPTGEGRALCGRIHADLATEYSELLRDYDEPVREAAIEVVRRLARSFSARVDTTGGSCCVVR